MRTNWERAVEAHPGLLIPPDFHSNWFCNWSPIDLRHVCNGYLSYMCGTYAIVSNFKCTLGTILEGIWSDTIPTRRRRPYKGPTHVHRGSRWHLKYVTHPIRGSEHALEILTSVEDSMVSRALIVRNRVGALIMLPVLVSAIGTKYSENNGHLFCSKPPHLYPKCTCLMTRSLHP